MYWSSASAPYRSISRRLHGSKGGESETELVVSSTAQGPAKNTIDKDRVDVLLNHSDESAWWQRQLKVLLTVGTEGWRGLSRSCRPTGLHRTMRLSVIICLLGSVSVVFKIYRAMALLKFSSRGCWQRLTEAQLRLAPNRPCMTLVISIMMCSIATVIWAAYRTFKSMSVLESSVWYSEGVLSGQPA